MAADALAPSITRTLDAMVSTVLEKCERLSSTMKDLIYLGHVSLIFSIVIQIQWKINCSVTPLLGIISVQNFAHAMIAQLSCHVQNFIATWMRVGWIFNQIWISVDKIIHEMGPCFISAWRYRIKRYIFMFHHQTSAPQELISWLYCSLSFMWPFLLPAIYIQHCCF